MTENIYILCFQELFYIRLIIRIVVASHKGHSQRPFTKAIQKGHSQSPFTKAIHKIHSQRPFTKSIHKVHLQRPFTKSIHKGHPQRPFTKSIHKGHSQRPFIKVIHSAFHLLEDDKMSTGKCWRIIGSKVQLLPTGSIHVASNNVEAYLL